MAPSGVSFSQRTQMGGCTFCCCFRTEIQSHWRNESSMSVEVKDGRGRYLGWKTDAGSKRAESEFLLCYYVLMEIGMTSEWVPQKKTAFYGMLWRRPGQHHTNL